MFLVHLPPCLFSIVIYFLPLTYHLSYHLSYHRIYHTKQSSLSGRRFQFHTWHLFVLNLQSFFLEIVGHGGLT